LLLSLKPNKANIIPTTRAPKAKAIFSIASQETAVDTFPVHPGLGHVGGQGVGKYAQGDHLQPARRKNWDMGVSFPGSPASGLAFDEVYLGAIVTAPNPRDAGCKITAKY
jgi:hypothetical protein